MTTLFEPSAKIKISSIDIIAQVNYKTPSQDCAICRQSLMAPSPSDISNVNATNNKIPPNHVDVGCCGHAFHRSCITTISLNNACTCPLDYTPWKLSDTLDSTTSWGIVQNNKPAYKEDKKIRM